MAELVVVVALVALVQRLVLPALSVRVHLVLLALLQVVAVLVVRARLLVLAHLLRVVVGLADLAVEALVLHRSFLAATVGSSTSVGIPPYAPVPRSRRKPNSRP